MAMLILVLKILGFVAFVAAAVNVSSPRLNLLAAGLACWLLAVILMG